MPCGFFCGCIRYTIRFESYDERLASLDLRYHLGLNSFILVPVSVFRPSCINTRSNLFAFLLFPDGAYLFFGQEARIGQAFCQKFLCKCAVNLTAMALSVVAVISNITAFGHTFIKADAEEVEGAYDGLHGIFDIALIIRVLNSEEKCTAALVRQPLVYECSVEIAQMDESRRAWTESRDHGALRKIPWRIHRFVVIRSMLQRRINEFA